MAANIDTGFENEEYLRSIREDFLNPLAKRVVDLKKTTETTYPLAREAFAHAEVDIVDKTLRFYNSDDTREAFLNLDGMFDETQEVKVGGTSVENIEFTDAARKIEGKKATISYDWPTLVKDNQEKLIIGQSSSSTTYIPKALYFKGPNFVVTNTSADITTVEVTNTPQLKAQIREGTESIIQKIKVVGSVDGTDIQNDVLTLNLPTGGSGTEGYFRGFFETLGDVISQVTNPVNDKTFVFVKDQTVPGDKYYNPYFYINNGWTEVPSDPAITYTAPTASQTQGVFSIKPDARITIDTNGQLDLSGLATEEAKLNFHGFFNTQADLESAVPRPILDKSFAYVKHLNGAWVGKVYRHSGSGSSWEMVLPLGSMSLVKSLAEPTDTAPIYGIAKNDDWDIEGNGIISLKAKPSELGVEYTDYAGTSTTNKFKTLDFKRGKSLVSVSDSKLTVEHPQRIINYNSTFEDAHNSQDYEGSVFYDETSRCWMGWGIPSAAGAVDVKWTRIAHPKMSDEVKDLSKRLPAKAPYVTPGVLGDAPGWEYTSWTFVQKDDINLPDVIRETCGGYFITLIQDVEDDTPRPKERLQLCYADEEGGHTFVRKWKRSDTVGDYGWSPWVKTSLSAKDISDHNTDPEAHTNHHRFYKVGTVDLTWKELKAKNYKIEDRDLLLIADSFGLSGENEETISIPYNGKFRFSGRIDFDGWSPSLGVYPTPQLMVYVYKVTNTQEDIIVEYAYNHTDHTVPMPAVRWRSEEVTLSYGDKIRFELKEFSGAFNNQDNLSLVTSRTFFVVEDIRTVAGSRIADTHKRTIGTINSKRDAGVNVHRNKPDSATVRVYGVPLSTVDKNMTKVKG